MNMVSYGKRFLMELRHDVLSFTRILKKSFHFGKGN